MPHRPLRTQLGTPTLYLLDEFHHHDPSTLDNVGIALELFRNGVVLAGVEGYEGGFEYDVHEHRYKDSRVDAPVSDVTLIGDYPQFAQELTARHLPVVGVDCRGLSDELEAAWLDGIRDISRHPVQQIRTDHFIRTLAEEAHDRGALGDLLLNCGSHHNDRIEAIVAKPGPVPAGWPDWNYVRIRSEKYPKA